MARGSSSEPPRTTNGEVINWNGPLKKHHCTDIICLLFFIVFLVAWGFVAFMAFKDGDISKVLYATDSNGRVCGNGYLKDRKYLLFFDLTRCLNPAVLAHGCLTPQVCVEKCPDTSFSGYALSTSGQGNKAKEMMKPYCDPYVTGSSIWTSKSAESLIKEGHCPAWVLASKPVLGRCMPAADPLHQDTSKANTARPSSQFKTVSTLYTSYFKAKYKQTTIDDPVVEASKTIDGKPISYPTLQQAVYSLTAFLNVRDFFFRFSEDLCDTWWMIGIALVAATVLSFIWILLMRFLTGLMVWLSVTLIFVLIGGLFGYCVFRYLLIMDDIEAQISIFELNITPDYFTNILELRDTWLAFTIILGVLFLVLILLFLALRRRIIIAIKMIEQGSKAVGQMCSSLMFPIIPFIFHAVFAMLFVAIAMYLSSYGQQEYQIFFEHGGLEQATKMEEVKDAPTPVCDVGQCVNPISNSVYKFGDSCNPEQFNQTCNSNSGCKVAGKETVLSCQFLKYQSVVGIRGWMQWFNLFGFYWSMNFVTAFGEMVLAGVFAKWYWTKDKSQIPCCVPLMNSIFNATVFHLGTIAFGSLIIAIIKIIRAIVSYVESKLKKSSNDLTKCLFCACKCCLWCLEKFMMFINRNAYIVCAVRSTHFLKSGKEAFTLIINNAVRTFVLNKMVDFLLFLGKMVIVVGAATMSYFVFYGYFPELLGDSYGKIPHLNYSFTPIICIAIGTYFITTSFFNVYSMAVDTLFLCFLQDLKQNDGTPQRPYFMSKGLQEAVGKMQKFREENIKQRLEYLNKEKQMLNEFEIQPMLEE